MAGQIVIAAMVVDTEDEAIARGVMADLAAGAEAETADIRWQLYPKTGPHSKVNAALRMPGIQEGQPVIDACERLASLVVAAESLPGAYLNSFIQDDGALFYNRIFDGGARPSYGASCSGSTSRPTPTPAGRPRLRRCSAETFERVLAPREAQEWRLNRLPRQSRLHFLQHETGDGRQVE